MSTTPKYSSNYNMCSYYYANNIKVTAVTITCAAIIMSTTPKYSSNYNMYSYYYANTIKAQQ